MKMDSISVLLIDDDQDDNYFHQLVLEESGLVKEVRIAQNSFEALAYLRSVKSFPDLIFLDANMPKMNGWEFIDEYRKLSDETNLTSIIIMLTTSLNPHDRKKATKIPWLNGFETKPLTSEMLDIIMHKYFSLKNT